MRFIVPSWMFVTTLTLLVALLFVSCSVLEPVGGAIAQGYENTVSYFNAYYNAKRLYDEAEAEVITYRLSQRGQRTAQGAQAQTTPPASRTKFSQVIEKCSSILSFHESSALVDDALLLIGKSYYYQSEFLKAERKFEELLAKDPAGELSLETQLWLLRCYAENGKNEEALQLGEALRASAADEGEDELEGQTVLVLARLAEPTDPESSARLLAEAVELLDEDVDQGTAQAKIGDLLRGLGRPEEAAEAYLEILDLTSDTYLRFYALVNAARTYGSLKRYDEALDLADELLDDYSFAPYWNETRLEVAEAKARLGRLEEALEDFEYIDTTAARTEVGTRAAFRRGWILEHDFGDYARAQVAYSRASAFAVPGVSTVAKQRENALARHRVLHQKLFVTDSVIAALAEPAPQLPDSAAAGRPAPNPDSLRAEITKARFELGELFYAELEVPDSAVFYYGQVLAAPPDSVRTPRVLYIMADLSRTQDLGTSPDSLYRVIIRDYPDSPYALASKEALGIPMPPPRTDPARAIYERAESMLMAGDHAGAVEEFEQIIRDHPTSEYAIRSRYALGWTYEYVLDQPDSALSQYRLLVAEHGSSPFAQRVRGKVSSTEPKVESSQDSLQIKLNEVERVQPEARGRTEREDPADPTAPSPQRGDTRQALPPKTPPPKKDD